MFQEKRLIQFIKSADTSRSTDVFDELQQGKIDTNKAVDKYFANKKARETKEDIEDIKDQLQNQLSANLPNLEKFLDSATATRLQRQLERQSPLEQKQIAEEVNSRRTNVRTYMNTLNTGSAVRLIDGSKVDVFTEDSSRGINSKKQYLEEFISLPIQDQAKWLKEIRKDIEERTKQFNKLLEFVQGRNSKSSEIQNFQKLRRSERTSYLQKLSTIDKDYTDLIDKSGVSQKGIKNRTIHFKSLGLEGKKLELAKLKEALSVPSKDKEFRALSPKRQAMFPDFYILSKIEKDKALKEARDEIAKEYNELIKNCPYQLSSADHKLFETTIKGRFDISMAEMCISSFESSVVKLAKFVSDELEEKEYPENVLAHFNWAKISTYERKQLLEDKTKIKEYAENQEHITLDNNYKKKLDKYVKEKPFAVLTEDSAAKYLKWYKELPLDKKKNIANDSNKNPKLDDLESTMQARKKLIKRFTKLPKAIQKEYKEEFAESGFEERMDLVLKIEKENDETDQEYKEKLDQMVEDRLLSAKSKDRYWKWFTQKLNLEQKNAYLNNCNLDKPERKAILEVFEETLIPALADKLLPGEIKKMENDFYRSDLNKRRDLLKGWIKKHIPDGKNLLKNRLNDLQDESAIENAKEIKTAYGPMLETAKKHEDNDDVERAVSTYEDILDSYELTEEDEKFIRRKIKTLKDECDKYESIEEGHFHSVVENEIQDILKSDTDLKREQERLTILEEVHGIQFRNEILFNRATTTAQQMDESLDDEYTSEFNEAFQDYDPNASLYYDEHDELQSANNESQFDVNEFDNQDNIKTWKNYVSHKQEDSNEKRFDPTLAIINPKTKQRYTSKQFDTELLYPARQEFIEKMYKKLLASLELDEDKMSPRAKNAIVNQLYNRDWRVKLQKSTNPSIAA